MQDFSKIALGKSMVLALFSPLAGCQPFLLKITRTGEFKDGGDDTLNQAYSWQIAGVQDYQSYPAVIGLGVMTTELEYVVAEIHEGAQLDALQKLLVGAAHGQNADIHTEFLRLVNFDRALSGLPMITIPENDEDEEITVTTTSTGNGGINFDALGAALDNLVTGRSRSPISDMLHAIGATGNLGNFSCGVTDCPVVPKQ